MDQEMYLFEKCKEAGIELEEDQVRQFMQFYEYLIKKNEVMNLTAITVFEDVVVKHFIDSLSIIRAVPEIKSAGYKILDLGSGAGFPGIPMKIAFPGLDIVLLDSLQKRVNFMNEAIEICGLSGIQAVHGRAEDLAATVYRESFDLCVSRAVANLSTLSEYCLPFVKTGGRFIAFKTPDIKQELTVAEMAISILGGKAKEPIIYTLAGEHGRSLLVVEKRKHTPAKYPRKSGTPSRAPL